MLASKETGMSHNLRTIRGVLIRSLDSPQPVFLKERLVGISSIDPAINRREVCAMVVLHIFFFGASSMVVEVPIVNIRRVNIFILRPILVPLCFIHIISLV